jgi:hypothetical protein
LSLTSVTDSKSSQKDETKGKKPRKPRKKTGTQEDPTIPIVKVEKVAEPMDVAEEGKGDPTDDDKSKGREKPQIPLKGPAGKGKEDTAGDEHVEVLLMSRPGQGKAGTIRDSKKVQMLKASKALAVQSSKGKSGSKRSLEQMSDVPTRRSPRNSPSSIVTTPGSSKMGTPAPSQGTTEEDWDVAVPTALVPIPVANAPAAGPSKLMVNKDELGSEEQFEMDVDPDADDEGISFYLVCFLR